MLYGEAQDLVCALYDNSGFWNVGMFRHVLQGFLCDAKEVQRDQRRDAVRV
jgi:hypothetical protein